MARNNELRETDIKNIISYYFDGMISNSDFNPKKNKNR